MPERAAPPVHELTALPATLPGYLRAVAGAFKPRHADSFPALGLRVRGVPVDAARVARYRREFELPVDGPVPPGFAHLLAAPLHLAILTAPRFPLRVLGTVHLRNPIRQQRALRAGERVDLTVLLGQPQQARSGIEYALRTEVHDGSGDLIWQGESVHLVRAARGPQPRPADAGEAPPQPRWERAWRLWLPAGAGRSYASLSGDWNPIHLSLPSARLFGFRRAVIHGMWSHARVLAALEPHLADGPLALEVRFRRPLLLPGAAVIRARRRDDRRGWEWALQDPRGEVVHAQGEVIDTR